MREKVVKSATFKEMMSQIVLDIWFFQKKFYTSGVTKVLKKNGLKFAMQIILKKKCDVMALFYHF